MTDFVLVEISKGFLIRDIKDIENLLKSDTLSEIIIHETHNDDKNKFIIIPMSEPTYRFGCKPFMDNSSDPGEEDQENALNLYSVCSKQSEVFTYKYNKKPSLEDVLQYIETYVYSVGYDPLNDNEKIAIENAISKDGIFFGKMLAKLC